MEFTIPLKPLSVNDCWQGRRFKTPAYKQYEQDCMWFIKGRKITGEVEVRVKLFVSNYRRDIDNPIKPLLDIIVKAGLIDDDSKVKKLVVEKFKSKDEKTEIIINKYS